MLPDYTIRSEGASGMLSQVILHVAQLDGHFRSQISELPSGLDELGKFAEMFAGNCEKLQIMQEKLGASIPMLEPLLLEARSLISLDDRENVRPYILQALEIGNNQLKMVMEVRDMINASHEGFLPIFAILHDWIDRYNREMAELDNEASEAQQMRKKYSDEKYYFLALGVLGLPGLATAIGLLVAWEEKAKKYDAQLNKLHHILFCIEQCKNVLTTMQGECLNIMNQLSEICNVQNLLLGDIEKIKEDIDHIDSAIFSLYLCSALGMLNTLKIDIS